MVSKWIKRIIYFLALIAMLIVGIINIVYINQIANNEVSSIEYYGIFKLFTSFIIAGLIIGVSYGLEKIKVGKKVKIGLIILALILYAIVQIVWILQSVATPYADSEQLIVIAKEMINENGLSEYCTNYMAYYSQQIPLVAIMVMLFKIFNTTSFAIFEYLNVICNVLTILGLYFITKRISEEHKCNKVLFWILSLTFIPIIMLATFVYGDFIGLAFAVWAIYFAMKYEKKDKIRNAVFTAIGISIACLFRMNYFIFAIAIGIYWFINILDKKNKKDTIKGIGILVLLILMIMLPSSIIKNVYTKKYNLPSDRSFSTVPYLYMGMSEGDYANGWYNNQMGDTVYHLMNDEQEKAEELGDDVKNNLTERVKYLLQSPIYTAKFYAKKLITTWAEPTLEYGFYNNKYPQEVNIEEHFVANHILNGRFYELSKVYQKALVYIIFIGAVIAVVVNRKKLDKEILLLMLTFLGGFGFHILWEAKSRYIIPYVIILIPVSIIGIDVIIQKIKNKFENKKEEKEQKLLKEKQN